jgi:hypothetical protein
MKRIEYTGTIYAIGLRIQGFDFGGRERVGAIIEVNEMGGWYAVRLNGWGDTAVIRFETACVAR